MKGKIAIKTGDELYYFIVVWSENLSFIQKRVDTLAESCSARELLYKFKTLNLHDDIPDLVTNYDCYLKMGKRAQESHILMIKQHCEKYLNVHDSIKETSIEPEITQDIEWVYIVDLLQKDNYFKDVEKI
jgi:hypothetical protein